LDSLGFLRPIRGFSRGYGQSKAKKVADPGEAIFFGAAENPPPPPKALSRSLREPRQSLHASLAFRPAAMAIDRKCQRSMDFEDDQEQNKNIFRRPSGYPGPANPPIHLSMWDLAASSLARRT